jgi:gas vesicle protein
MSEPNNDGMENTESQASTRVAWFLVGVAIGAGAAVLFAPRSGKDTRQYITRRTHEGREAVEATGRDIVDRGRDFYDKGRDLVEDAVDLFERGRKLMRG